jgi:hypothetical protein
LRGDAVGRPSEIGPFNDIFDKSSNPKKFGTKIGKFCSALIELQGCEVAGFSEPQMTLHKASKLVG